MEHIETEYKWAVNKRSDFKKLKNILAAQGWDCAFSVPVLLDSYFDAPGGALSAEKSALRLRKTVLDGKTFYELTLKSSSEVINGLARRKEITVALNAQNRREALTKFRAEAAKLNKKAVSLGRLFSIANKRKTFLINAPEFKAELSFDDCLIKSGTHKKLLEAELEFKGGQISAFNAFAAYLGRESGLKAPIKSKVATARALLSHR